MVEACQVTTAAMSAESRKLTLAHPPPTAANTAALAATYYFPSLYGITERIFFVTSVAAVPRYIFRQLSAVLL